MWIKADTQLSESVFQVTTPVSSHFLIFGDVLALVDTGIAAYGELLVEQLKKHVNEDLPLRFVFITHSHFDHIGALPFLRAFAPGVEVVGSPVCEEILASPEYLRTCYEKNKSAAEALNRPLGISFEDWSAAVRLDRIVGEGDTILLGSDTEIKVIASPGHAPDCLAYFVRGDAALAPAEAAGGYFGRDKIAPCFLSEIDDYLATIDKFLSLDIKVIGLPHNGALSGELAKKFLMDSRDSVQKFSQGIKERLEGGAIKEEIFFDVLNEWSVEGLSPEGPFVEAQREVVKRMIDIVLAGTPNAE